MANYVKTIIRFDEATDEEFENIVDKYTVLQDSGDTIDFRKILPIPDDIYMGPLGEKERRMYGDRNWYDWCWKNWGTKWNAFEGSVDYDTKEIIFSTAWSFAEKVVGKLAELTKQEIFAEYADEDLGSNVGRFIFHAGDSVDDDDIISYSDEAWDIIQDIWGVSKDEFEMET